MVADEKFERTPYARAAKVAAQSDHLTGTLMEDEMGTPHEVQPLDATTREGFLEIAQAFGRDRAHAARIAQLEELYERDRDFRWFGSKWERLVWSAKFDRDWERDNPGFVTLMIEGGHRSATF